MTSASHPSAAGEVERGKDALRTAFGLIRVINLPERTDRRREITAQLETLGIPISPGTVEMFAGIRPTEAAGFPNPAARGCFLSHLEVLRDARLRGVASLLVIEDDLQVLAGRIASFAVVLEGLKQRECGILHLGHAEQGGPDMRQGLNTIVGPVHMSHFYAVHRSAFDPLIDYLEQCLVRRPGDPIGGPMHFDGALTMFRRWNSEVVTLIAQPSLGRQRASRSDISPSRIDRIPLIRPAIHILRQLRRSFDS